MARRRDVVPKGTSRAGRGKGAPRNHLNNLDTGHHIAARMLRDVMLHGSRSRVLSALMEGDQDWSVAMREFKQDLVTSLGGADKLNVESWELLSVILIDKLINDSISSYLLVNPAINRQRKKCFEIVLQRSKLAGDYIGRLRLLRETVKRSKDLTMDEIRSSLRDAEDESG